MLLRPFLISLIYKLIGFFKVDLIVIQISANYEVCPIFSINLSIA